MSKVAVALTSFAVSRRSFVVRFKALLVATLVVAVAMVLAASHRDASAATPTTLSVSGEGLAAATAAETAFLAGLGSVTTETFEGFTAANPSSKPLFFDTSVGRFTQTLAGSDGACEATTCTGLSILSAGTTPFLGRFAVDGSNWLDSNDSKKMTWTPAFSFPTHVGFYITDPNDAGGEMDIIAVDGSSVSVSFLEVFDDDLDNGRVFYLSVFDPDGIASLKFVSNDRADGYGIDRFSTSPIPEPEIYAMMLAGLGLMGFVARRRKQQAAGA